MASVWCAEDRTLGRSVAIKVLAERFAHDEAAVRRFKREARAAARVSAHPHVVTIFDVGDTEPPAPAPASGDTGRRAFIVMEHLTGGTVSDALCVGAVRRQEAIRWLREAASALDHAHQRGIVHRDIKPANLLLDSVRRLHVADFGIARLVSEDTITSSGELFGTAAYLAPEQALGADATSASDRYSLSVVAFELLTGERPFTASHFAAQARQHIEDQPPRPSERHRGLPEAVDGVLIRGMGKAPEDRYPTATELVEALEAALSASPATTAPPHTQRTRPLGVRALPIAGSPAIPASPAPTSPRSAPDASTRVAARLGADRTRPVAAAGRVPGSSPIPPGRRRRRGGRAVALSALMMAAVGVALLIALGQLGTGGSRRSAPRLAARTATTSRTATTNHTTAAHRPASAPTQRPHLTPTTVAASNPPSSAADLQSRGHELMFAGSYPAAIATLRQAVGTADPSSLTYAYALYDLGRSLMLSGDPRAAIPVLQQRLEIPDQTPVVQQQLQQALQAAGLAPTPATPPPASSPPPRSGAGSGSPPSAPGHGQGGQDRGQGHHDGGTSVGSGRRRANGMAVFTLPSLA